MGVPLIKDTIEHVTSVHCRIPATLTMYLHEMYVFSSFLLRDLFIRLKRSVLGIQMYYF